MISAADSAASDCQGILVVEDDTDIRETIRDLLSDEGYLVRTAENGQRGLDALAHGERPCLVLLDMMMPIMDGAGFLQRLNEKSLLPGIPVVIVSAVAQHHVPGTAGFLRKPVDLEKLLDCVRQHCPDA